MKQYAILFNVQSKNPVELARAVEPALERLGLDWLRLTTGQYFVNSAYDENFLYTAIVPLLSDNDFVFIVELNLSNRRGWAQQVTIDWVQRVAP